MLRVILESGLWTNQALNFGIFLVRVIGDFVPASEFQQMLILHIGFMFWIIAFMWVAAPLDGHFSPHVISKSTTAVETVH